MITRRAETIEWAAIRKQGEARVEVRLNNDPNPCGMVADQKRGVRRCDNILRRHSVLNFEGQDAGQGVFDFFCAFDYSF